MPFDNLLAETLFSEAGRQLTICNSCRYCAGYCPVWPALELRTELERADITHLANLCHDCQDCYTACMYTPPHEFGVNPPRVFAAVREDTYHRYVWPGRPVAGLRGRTGAVAAAVAIALLLVVLALLTGTGSVFSAAGARSPYQLLPHPALLAVALAPVAYTAIVMAVAAGRYWRDIDGSLRALADPRAWARCLQQTAALSHQSGGAEGCSYPDGRPSAARRHFHQLLAWGFLLTIVSTVSAWVEETFLGHQPPYPVLSVPVVSGTVGGVMAVAGCAGLLALKRRSNPLEITASMRRADYALLRALLLLMLTGLGVLVSRDSAAFAPVLVLHLTLVITAFAIAPYTKFFHWVFRLLSMQHDNREARARRPG